MTENDRAAAGEGHLDLAAYLERIGLGSAGAPTLASLRALHLAHVTHVPFENLDIQMGRPIGLDLPSLERKLVRLRRGGYCFEQNTLFAHVLEALGFDVTPCEARVRAGAQSVRPRTHMVLLVRVAGAERLADVGFGGDGLLEPAPMDGRRVVQGFSTFRVVDEGAQRVLQLQRPEGWEDQYAFLPERRFPVDFVVGNWFTSTHPESSFVKTLTAQLATPAARHVLRNLTYTVTRASGTESREIPRTELVPLLRDVFGLDVPDGARFRALDG